MLEPFDMTSVAQIREHFSENLKIISGSWPETLNADILPQYWMKLEYRSHDSNWHNPFSYWTCQVLIYRLNKGFIITTGDVSNWETLSFHWQQLGLLHDLWAENSTLKQTFSWFYLYSVFFASIFSSVEQIHSLILRDRFNLRYFHNCAYLGIIFGLVPVSRPILSNNLYYSNIKGFTAAMPRNQNRNGTWFMAKKKI